MSHPDAAGFSTLLPASETPPREALLAHSDSLGSDIFPETYPEKSRGILGDYLSPTLPGNSPLQPLMGTLIARSNRLKAEERRNGYIPTEETESGLSVVNLQIHLALCIDKGYLNVLKGSAGNDPRIAFAILAGYIDERDEMSYDRYTDQVGTLVAAQAKAESFSGRSEPAEEQQGTSGPRQQIRQAELRLERLRFEWLSARAIEQIMKRSVLAHAEE